MNVLNLARFDDLNPKKVASTRGGEYHSPCPGCGGRDRFIIWDQLDRYLCRQCQKSGDAIQYYRDFRGMTYIQACEALHLEPKKRSPSFSTPPPAPIFSPAPVCPPSVLWQNKAQEFVEFCRQQLSTSPHALTLLQKRGFTSSWIEKFCFGWNPTTVWLPRSSWGLEEREGKKLWLPRGLLIPVFDPLNGQLIKLKIRRDDWKEGDELPKYVEISGSMQCPSVFQSPAMKLIAFVVEAEFDAMLIHQFASDLCFTVALGGATKRPDASCHQLLKKAERIVLALDVDQAGAHASRWWKSNYSSLKLWFPPVGKSPGDAWAAGVDLRYWVVEGICESDEVK